MKTPRCPENEKSRLRDLRFLNILDTPPEERFDRLVRIAKCMFNVPIAMVSFVDEDRQWFKSCIGVSVKETPRDISFCGHVILGDDAFIIPDAARDERFADNPLVTNEPNIRFYAGCPIRLPSGSKIGTLCINDTKPRHMSDEEIGLLKDLTVMVEKEIAAFQVAILDDLTKISNRRGFLMLAQKSLDYCKRNRIHASSIFFDLNSFKQINDTFGHAEGDRALIVFSNLILKNMRDADIFARLGGDEFIALLTNTPEKGANVVVSNIQKSLDDYNRKTGSGYVMSFSHGIAEYDPERHSDIEDLIAEGDSLMYESKK